MSPGLVAAIVALEAATKQMRQKERKRARRKGELKRKGKRARKGRRRAKAADQGAQEKEAGIEGQLAQPVFFFF